jgi:hypothetical protein
MLINLFNLFEMLGLCYVNIKNTSHTFCIANMLIVIFVMQNKFKIN